MRLTHYKKLTPMGRSVAILIPARLAPCVCLTASIGGAFLTGLPEGFAAFT